MNELKNRLSYIILGQKGGKNRVAIINLLRERPYNLNQMSDLLELNYRTIRHHVNVLIKNEMVQSSRTGTYGEVYFLTEDLEQNLNVFEGVVDKFDDILSSPDFFKDLIERSHECIIILNLNEEVIFLNGSAQELIGHTLRDFDNKKIQIFESIKDQRDTLKNARNMDPVIGYDTVFKTGSGKTVEVSLTMDRVLDNDNHHIGYSIIARDISHRKNGNGKQTRRIADLEEALKERNGDLKREKALRKKAEKRA